MKTLCIAGKNDIAVSVMTYARKAYKDTLNIVAIPNEDDKGIDGWQKSYMLYCINNGVKIVKLEDIYDLENLYFLSLEYNRILKPDKFISSRLYNIHFSKLPSYKGVYTSVHPILNNEKESGVTLHKIRHGIDTGEIIAQKTFDIDYDWTGYDLYKHYIYAGTKLAIEYLDQILNDSVCFCPQKAVGASYYSKQSIDFNNIELDINKTAEEIHNQIRAFSFRPYQFIKHNGIALINSIVTNNESTEKPGTILSQDEVTMQMTTVDYDLILFKDTFDRLIKAIRDGNNEYAKKLAISRTVVYEEDAQGMSAIKAAKMTDNSDIIAFFEKQNDKNIGV